MVLFSQKWHAPHDQSRPNMRLNNKYTLIYSYFKMSSTRWFIYYPVSSFWSEQKPHNDRFVLSVTFRNEEITSPSFAAHPNLKGKTRWHPELFEKCFKYFLSEAVVPHRMHNTYKIASGKMAADTPEDLLHRANIYMQITLDNGGAAPDPTLNRCEYSYCC